MHESKKEENSLRDGISKISDLIWAVSRHGSIDKFSVQKAPSWTGFHYEITPPNYDTITHTIFFLPTFNPSPKKFDTIQKVLRQTKAKFEKYGL